MKDTAQGLCQIDLLALIHQVMLDMDKASLLIRCCPSRCGGDIRYAGRW